MSEAWIETASNAIAGDRTDLAQLDRLERAAPHIGAYQRFRARVLQLGADAMAIFAELARVPDKLDSLDDEALEPVVRRILGAEARSALLSRLDTCARTLLRPAAALAATANARAAADLGTG